MRTDSLPCASPPQRHTSARDGRFMSRIANAASSRRTRYPARASAASRRTSSRTVSVIPRRAKQGWYATRALSLDSNRQQVCAILRTSSFGGRGVGSLPRAPRLCAATGVEGPGALRIPQGGEHARPFRTAHRKEQPWSRGSARSGKAFGVACRHSLGEPRSATLGHHQAAATWLGRSFEPEPVRGPLLNSGQSSPRCSRSRRAISQRTTGRDRSTADTAKLKPTTTSIR